MKTFFPFLAGMMLGGSVLHAASITAVAPASVAQGTILTVSGTGFPTNGETVAIALTDTALVTYVPVTPLLVTSTQVLARVGPLPAGLAEGRLVMVFGRGNAGPLPDLPLLGGAFRWQQRATGPRLVTTNQLLAYTGPALALAATAPAPADSGTNWFFSTCGPDSPLICLRLTNEFPANTSLAINALIRQPAGVAGVITRSFQLPEVILPATTSATNAALTLANVLTNALASVGTPASVSLASVAGGVELRLGLPATVINSGSLLVTARPAEAGRTAPYLTAVVSSPPGGDGLLKILGGGFGNIAEDLDVRVTTPFGTFEAAVLTAQDGMIVAEPYYHSPTGFTATVTVRRGIGMTFRAAPADLLPVRYWSTTQPLPASLTSASDPATTKTTWQSTLENFQPCITFKSGGPGVGTLVLTLLNTPSGTSGTSYSSSYVPTTLGMDYCTAITQAAGSNCPVTCTATSITNLGTGVKICLPSSCSNFTVTFCPQPKGKVTGYIAQAPDTGACQGNLSMVPLPMNGPAVLLINAPGFVPASNLTIRGAEFVRGTFVPAYADVTVGTNGTFYLITNRTPVAVPVNPTFQPPSPGTVCLVSEPVTNRRAVLRLTNGVVARTRVRLTVDLGVTNRQPAALGAVYPDFVILENLSAEETALRLADAITDGFARNLGAPISCSVSNVSGIAALAVEVPLRALTNACIRVCLDVCQEPPWVACVTNGGFNGCWCASPTDATLARQLVRYAYDGSPGLFVDFAPPAFTNRCGPENVLVCCLPPGGSFFPLGTNLVVCEVRNLAGSRTSCSFPVIVRANPANDLRINHSPDGPQLTWTGGPGGLAGATTVGELFQPIGQNLLPPVGVDSLAPHRFFRLFSPGEGE